MFTTRLISGIILVLLSVVVVGQGGVLLFSVVVCLVNLLVDIAYMIIDPRIRDNKGFGGKRGRLQKAKPQAVLQGGNK